MTHNDPTGNPEETDTDTETVTWKQAFRTKELYLLWITRLSIVLISQVIAGLYKAFGTTFINDDSFYGSISTSSAASKQMATRKMETLRSGGGGGVSRSNSKSYSRILQPNAAKELTYSYSSSEEDLSTENDESSLHGSSFGGGISAVVT